MKHSSRRSFLKRTAVSLAAVPLVRVSERSAHPASSGSRGPGANMTIQDVIDLLIQETTGAPLTETVDTVKSGDPTQEVTGIVTTFLATAKVIQQAADQGANLIVTHEPTYYNHTDDVAWLEGDPVYAYKRGLLEKHGIVVWRFHDYWHRHRPDGILTGFLKTIGWEQYLDPTRENVCVIEPIALAALAAFFKTKLQLGRTFYVGDGTLMCRQVALLPGAWGRQRQIEALRREDVEVIVVGEVSEWETAEYARDAAFAGMKKGLIILGHARSEEPGMAWLAEWLPPRVPNVPVIHIPATDPFVPV